MFDVEKQMAHEAEQQDLLQGILGSLHQAIEDDYLTEFNSLARICLRSLKASDCLDLLNGLIGDALIPLISEPLSQFTSEEVERKHLLALLMEKLIRPVLGEHASNYRRATMITELALVAA